MNGIIMLLLIIGVIYVAFTYLKGPRNTETYRNTFNMQNFNGDTWHDDLPPELPENDETEMESDGEDMEEIGFYTNEAEASMESELPAVLGVPTTLETPATPAVYPVTPTAAAEKEQPEALPVNGVIIDTEVCIDAKMTSDNK
jgi:hypothetical protein